MIIRVPVATELIEQAFTTGYSTHGALTVAEGLPEGAALLRIEPSAGIYPDTWDFVFEAPGGLDTETRAVVVRHQAATV